jgi:hypothetical protein
MSAERSSDYDPSDYDLSWYQSQWSALMEALSVSDPEAVVGEVKRLCERAATLENQHEALAELNADDPERALQMIENMADQLEELYAEREAAARESSSRP